MNTYVLKGVLLDANPSSTTTTLKSQVFNAISFPGFTSPTYGVMGVEFGLGIMELTHHTKLAIVKIQIWNLDERRNIILTWRHFLAGSRVGIITWNYSRGNDLAPLGAMIKDCLEKCPDISIGIVMMHDEDGASRLESVGAIDPLLAAIENEYHLKATVDRNLEAMMSALVSGCLDNAPAIHVLPVRHPAELGHVPSIQDPFFNYFTRVSDKLIRFLEQQGIRIEVDNAILETKEHVFHINLANASLHVAPKQCLRCRDDPCCDAFSKVCIVPDSQIKKGYSSESLGFTPTDLFVLSMVFAIRNNSLPPSVSGQFPRGKPCIRRR